MLQKTNLLITGLPGCGKSTLINRIVSQARQQGLKVGGISTPEFRLQNGKRGGFYIRDIASGNEQVMASVNTTSPIRVGRYGVNLEAVRDVGVTAITSAITSADLVTIDEIGRMELAVSEFSLSVNSALDSPKPVLGTIGLKLKTPFVITVKTRKDVTVLTLTPETRQTTFQQACTLLGL